MKKIIGVFAIAISIAACNSAPKQETKSGLVLDTTGDYQRYLADSAREVANAQISDDTIVTNTGEQYVKIDPNANNNVNSVAATSNNSSSRTTKSSGSSNGSSSSKSSSSGSGTSSSQSAPVAQKKKGWSNAAKGTAIGAGAGAVTGAIISKKKGKGAVIGGVVGAAGGYIIGRNKDKKEAGNQ